MFRILVAFLVFLNICSFVFGFGLEDFLIMVDNIHDLIFVKNFNFFPLDIVK